MPMAIPERYNTGYSIGVGGAVVRDGRLLFVRRASRHGRGNWQLPGGFIESDLVDPRYFGKANIENRVQSFLQMLAGRKNRGRT